MKVVLSCVPPTRRHSMTLAYKKEILREAGQSNSSIKATAKKYGVEPVQIRKWKKAFEDAMTKAIEAPIYPGRVNPTVTKTYRRLCSNNRRRYNHGGRPTLFSSEFL
jgi:transposase-like protein